MYAFMYLCMYLLSTNKPRKKHAIITTNTCAGHAYVYVCVGAAPAQFKPKTKSLNRFKQFGGSVLACLLRKPA